MLKPLDKLNLTNQQRFDNVMVHHWIAVDPDTGATLTRSFGRTKYGDVRCTLILPKKTPVEAGGWWEAASSGWDLHNETRKFIQAWNFEEAVELANKKLARMLKKLGRATVS